MTHTHTWMVKVVIALVDELPISGLYLLVERVLTNHHYSLLVIICQLQLLHYLMTDTSLA